MGSLLLEKVLEQLAADHIQQVSFWSDCGAHFRSYAMMARACVRMVRKYRHSFAWNFYGERHGKGRVDGFFGLLDQWLKAAAACGEVLNYEHRA